MKIKTVKDRIEQIQKKINEEDENIWEPCRSAYEGDRSGLPEDLHDVNLIWGTIRTLIPELMYNVPRFKLKSNHIGMTEDLRQKNEALLNAIIAEKDMSFSEVIKSTILAAHLNLGIVTWGCNSEFKPHPLAGQKIPESSAVYPDKIAPKDSYFIKRIRAQDFYPDLFSGEIFLKLRHYTIAELMSKSDIHKMYKIPLAKLEGGVSYSMLDERLKERLKDEERYDSTEIKDEYIRFRVFKMYDRERDKVYVFCNEYDKFFEIQEFPKTESVAVLKFNSKLDEFWPIHEITQAQTSQREIEIASSMLSEHVKRSAKKIGIRRSALSDTTTLSKLEDPYSHTGIPFDDPSDTWPIDFGTCDPSIYNHTNIQKEFFNQIMGVSSSARGGAAPKRTATAEIIQDKKLNVRQQDKIKIIREFLSIVGNGINNCIGETLTLAHEVEVLGPEEEPYVVQYIKEIDLHGDYDCTIDLAELAAPNEEVERNQWVGLIDILGRSPMVFSNPVLTKETLKRFGIDNKELVKAFMEIATRQMQMQADQVGGGGGTGGGKNLPAQGGLGAMMGQMIAGGVSGGG